MKRWCAALIADGRGQADEQALISLIGAGVFFGLEIYSVIFHGQNFDAFGFGAGVGALLGAASAGFGLRARWSPQQTTDPTINPVTGRFTGGLNAHDNL